ncbi:hypothetical protein Malapachy_0612 [Malassezia pachydermatis]|uniref:Roadblock/LAMTOR2 domain-containing protein n=1 Tax=Malassezia pachydermatis TaxID=77020 RepID=A0A0N0RRZ3_9BASI|nr:hypothetical protein Malapachy_0612 [Malassezia pachydermatis]KOS12822.1 hypothetical protein Malapachy_0612 [Malassezia pachydermatis]
MRVIWSGGAALASSDQLDRLVSFVRDTLRVSWRHIDTMEKDDELSLLRLRTKKYELLVTPSEKYILVVLHDPGHAL